MEKALLPRLHNIDTATQKAQQMALLVDSNRLLSAQVAALATQLGMTIPNALPTSVPTNNRPNIPNNNNTAIVDTGAIKNYLIPTAPVTNINYNAAPSTISTSTEQLLQSSTNATINIPWLPPGTSTRKFMPNFVNNLLRMGVFWDANCTVTFTKTYVTVYNAHSNIILWGIRESNGAKMWQINLTTDTANNANTTTPQMRPNIIPFDNYSKCITNGTAPPAPAPPSPSDIPHSSPAPVNQPRPTPIVHPRSNAYHRKTYDPPSIGALI